MIPVILGKPARRTGWGWRWRAGCVAVEIHEPIAEHPDGPHMDAFMIRVFIYGEDVVLAYESTAPRAAALVTRRLRQIKLCLDKVVGSA